MKLVCTNELIDARGTKSHYVTWAVENALAFGFAGLLFGVGMSEKDVRYAMSEANRRRETVCLPEHKATILPDLPNAEDEVIYQNFNDAVKAQNLHVRSETVIWDMRPAI